MLSLNQLRNLLGKLYATDYIGLITLFFVYSWIQFRVRPFHSLFSLDDLRIQHPFTENERVPVGLMFVYGGAVPLVMLAIISIIIRPGWQQAHATIIGLFISLILTSFLTDVVKNAVGRPRPDFLSRCQPKRDGSPRHALLSIDACAQKSQALLDEGFRSFPSGHSSFSFSGLGYLSLYLAGQMKVFHPRAGFTQMLAALIPLLGALMIAISRLEDYRHDVYDVTAGSILGLTIAHITYRRYYPSLSTSHCNIPYPAVSAKAVDTYDEERNAGLDRQDYEALPLQDRP